MKKTTKKDEENNMRAALTPEAREQQLIYLATELAEKQLREGSASSQVITHYLKLGSSKEKIEKEILERQKDLITAKTEALQTSKKIEELYSKAILAMQRYSGNNEETIDDETDKKDNNYE